MQPPLSASLPADAAAHLAAEQEVENLSGLSPNPEKDIFVVRENRTTCLMAEFAAKFIVPYDVWASNYVDVSGGRGYGGPGGGRDSRLQCCSRNRGAAARCYGRTGAGGEGIHPYFWKVLYPL